MGHFSFAGEHCGSYSVYLLRSPLSIFPGAREKVIVMPGRHGVFRMPPDFETRVLSLDCWLKITSYGELYQQLDRLRSWLNPMRGAQRLVFDDSPDRYYLATWADADLQMQVTASQGLFTLRLACDDPFAYDLAPDELLITTSPYTHYQRGTAPSDPLFLLRGISGGGSQFLTVRVNEEQFTYRGALSAGERLEVDGRHKTAALVRGEAREKALHLLERPSFPQLTPGANTIQVVAAGGATWSNLEISCRNRWL